MINIFKNSSTPSLRAKRSDPERPTFIPGLPRRFLRQAQDRRAPRNDDIFPSSRATRSDPEIYQLNTGLPRFARNDNHLVIARSETTKRSRNYGLPRFARNDESRTKSNRSAINDKNIY